MGASYEEEISQQISQLTPEQQQDVLKFVQSLNASTPKGTPGEKLLKFVGIIPHDDLEEMKSAIEEGCEQVDPDGW